MAELKYLTITSLTPKVSRRIGAKIVVDPDTDCWLWIARLNEHGYGTVYFEGHQELAHRVVYAWLVGPLQRGSGSDVPELDHVICKRRACVNPVHVELVPHRINVLRSNTSIPAINARKTHCKRGHRLPTMPNRSDGHRRCMICCREERREYFRLWQKRYRQTAKYRQWKSNRRNGGSGSSQSAVS